MSKVNDEKNYILNETTKVGNVSIADDVVAAIAGVAATEVEGVSKLTGNIPNELVSKLGKKNLSKGVKVLLDGKEVIVDLSLEIAYGYNIKNISVAVQDKVKQAIENMTGLNTVAVNVKISAIKLSE